jgi:hypothetical protein
MFFSIKLIDDTVRNTYEPYARAGIMARHQAALTSCPPFETIMPVCNSIMPRLCQRGRTDRSCGILGKIQYPRAGSASSLLFAGRC